MKLPQGLAIATTPSFTDAPDIHLLFMVGLAFFAGIAGLCAVSLLLLLAPLATLFLGRTKPRRIAAAASAGPVPEPDGGATQLPPPLTGGDKAA